ncbi:MAG: hypothetical protein ACRDG8_10265 [Actinomycetota bacterium]
MTAPSSELPLRPDAPSGAVRPVRRWLPAGLVALAISVTVLGGFVVAETLPEPESRPVALAGVLVVRPLSGWEVAHREALTVPTPAGLLSGEFAQITRGSGALDLLAFPGVGRGEFELADAYVREVLSRQLERLSVSHRVEAVVLRSGVEALRFGYIGSEPRSGSAVEGSVTVVVSPAGNGAVFDGWAFRGQLELLLEELAAMVDGAEVA